MVRLFTPPSDITIVCFSLPPSSSHVYGSVIAALSRLGIPWMKAPHHKMSIQEISEEFLPDLIVEGLISCSGYVATIDLLPEEVEALRTLYPDVLVINMINRFGHTTNTKCHYRIPMLGIQYYKNVIVTLSNVLGSSTNIATIPYN